MCWTFLLKLTTVQNIRSQDMFCCNLATQWLIRILYSDRRMAWPVMLISKLIGQKIALTMLTPIRANREQRVNDLNRILYNWLQISLSQDLTQITFDSIIIWLAILCCLNESLIFLPPGRDGEEKLCGFPWHAAEYRVQAGLWNGPGFRWCKSW